MRWIDSHAHIDMPAWDQDPAALFARAASVGVEAIVVPGYRAADFGRIADCVQANQIVRLHPAYGLHPVYLPDHDLPGDWARLEAALQQPGVVAVGEIGLDRFLPALTTPVAWAQQIEIFETQLAMARSRDLPVILHVRRAHADLVRSLKRVGVAAGGVVHAFAGSWDEAQAYLRLGLCLGVGGVITYDSARRVRRVAAQLPLSSVVLETDSPDMPAQGWQGRPHEPAALPEIFAAWAALRSEPPDQLMSAVWQNTQRLFRLSEAS